MAAITLTNVSKSFGSVEVLKDINLTIADQEFCVLVGPSGCGKSTLSRWIAGLEEVQDGTIEIGGDVVNELRPRDRNLAMVFQSHALYPHKTVRENLSFSLKTHHRGPDLQHHRHVDGPYGVPGRVLLTAGTGVPASRASAPGMPVHRSRLPKSERTRAQIRIDGACRRVELKPPLLDQLHRRRTGDGLGHGCGPPDRVRRHGAAAADRAFSETAFMDGSLRRRRRRDDPRHVSPRYRNPQDPVHAVSERNGYLLVNL